MIKLHLRDIDVCSLDPFFNKHIKIITHNIIKRLLNQKIWKWLIENPQLSSSQTQKTQHPANQKS